MLLREACALWGGVLIWDMSVWHAIVGRSSSPTGNCTQGSPPPSARGEWSRILDRHLKVCTKQTNKETNKQSVYVFHRWLDGRVWGLTRLRQVGDLE
jgi:hypothetical protein